MENIHSVSKRQWKKWPTEAQEVFNELYEDMMSNKELFLNPKGPVPLDVHWKTTAWNAAWMAADYVRTVLKNKTS